MAKNNQQVATRTQTTAVDAGAASVQAVMKRFMDDLDRRMPIVQHLLPVQMQSTNGHQRFRAMVLTAIANSRDGKLMECSPSSLLKACAECAQDGLSLAPQHKQADIIPRWNKKLNGDRGGLEANYQPRYGGLMVLARRSGEIKNIYAHEVRAKDEFSYELGLAKTIHYHRPAKGERGDLVNAYCVWEMKDGTKDFEVLDAKDIARAKRVSQSKSKDGEFYGPWKDDEGEMWRKTAIRRASKFMPSSAEDFQRAVQREMMNDVGEPMASDFDLPDMVVDGEAETGAEAQTSGARQLDRLENKVGKPDPKPDAKPDPKTEQKAEPKAEPKTETKNAPETPAADAQIQDGMTVQYIKTGNKIEYEASNKAWCSSFDVLKTDDERRAWVMRHMPFLEAVEMSAPDKCDEILTKTSPFRSH